MEAVFLQVIIRLSSHRCKDNPFSYDFPLQLSKTTRISGSPAIEKVADFSEWCVAHVNIINESYDLYTFDGLNDTSDIDITIANYIELNRFRFSWTVEIEEPVKMEDIGLAVAELKSCKSPAYDSITRKMCKIIWNAIREHFHIS